MIMPNPRPASLWTTQSVVATLALISLVPMAVSHLTGAALNPVSAPISHYVYLPGGYPMVLLGALLLAGCGAVLAADLIRRSVRTAGPVDPEFRRHRLAAGLLISFAVALTVVGVFPTDPPGSPSSSASAVAHRIGAAWSFLSLPLAGVLLAGSCRPSRPAVGRILVRAAAGLSGAAVIFLSIHLPLALTGSGIPAFGLLERIGFAFMIGYLILVAAALRPRPAAELPAEVVPAVEPVGTVGLAAEPARPLVRAGSATAATGPAPSTRRLSLVGAGRE